MSRLRGWSNGSGAGRPIIIKEALKNFDRAGFEPDAESGYEPVCHVLGRSAEELSREWAKTNQTWRDSLDFYESVQYTLPMPVERAWVKQLR